MVSIQFGSEWIRFQNSGTSFPARAFIEVCCQSDSLPVKVVAYPHRTWALILASSDSTHERLVEDFEMSDTFWPLVSGGCYFLRIEEDPVKYEFFRRPQLIFKKDFVFPPKKYSNNRRFEDAIEAYFRDHSSLDYNDSQRELRVQQDLKWSSDPISSQLHKKEDVNPGIRSQVLLSHQNNRKWSKAHFLLRADAQMGPILMYSPKSGSGVSSPFTTASKEECFSTSPTASTVSCYLFAVLRDCQIFYSTTEKKKHGGFVIIFQPKTNNNSTQTESSDYCGDIKYLLMESRAHFNCWLSALRLAKHGEILRTSYDRNICRLKSMLPVRLPPEAQTGQGDERVKGHSRTRAATRPLIGSFSMFQERMMNSFPIPSWRATSKGMGSSPTSSWSHGIDVDATTTATSHLSMAGDTSSTTAASSQILSASSSSSAISSQAPATLSSAATSSSSEWSLLSTTSSNPGVFDNSKTLLISPKSKSSREGFEDDEDLIEEESGDHSVLVPLEFSGGETRVLTDPEEIKEIQCHEMERYYHRKYGHLTEEPWFTCRTKEEVESILIKNGTIDGYFMVRVNMSQNVSDVSNEPFFLCLVNNEKIVSKKIYQRYLFQEPVYILEDNRFCFKDVSSLIDFCKLNLLNNMPCVLTEHPFRK